MSSYNKEQQNHSDCSFFVDTAGMVNISEPLSMADRRKIPQTAGLFVVDKWEKVY